MFFVILMVIGFGGEFASERQQRRGRGSGSVICVFVCAQSEDEKKNVLAPVPGTSTL